MTSLVLTGFVRVVTHPRVFDPPSPLDVALAFADEIRGHDNCIPLEPGERHWELFTALCRKSDARGNPVTDAHIAAVARESGAVLATTDADFCRFDGLRRTHPLAEG